MAFDESGLAEASPLTDEERGVRSTAAPIVTSTQKDLAERCSDLFVSYENAHGSFKVTGQSENGKVKGEAITLPGPASPELWQLHLEGGLGLGAIPVKKNASCQFGLVDLDIYDLDPRRVAAQLVEWKIPAIAARSKSGGIHVYLWCNADVPAPLFKQRLAEIAKGLGYPGAECFPKQDAPTDKGGNWVNLPYYEGDSTTRYGVNPSGDAYTLAEFVDAAERLKAATGPEWFSTPLRLPSAPESAPKGARKNRLPAERVPVERILSGALEKLKAGGTRNNTGLWYLAQLRDNGYSRDEALLTLREWACKANEATPGQDRYTMKEAEATLRSVYSKEARDPWDEPEKESHADILLKLTDDFEYFKSGPANDPYVRMTIGDHHEVWKVDNKSPKVREILTHRFLKQKDRAPSREALNTAIDTVMARCGMGSKLDVHVRFARNRNAVYLDMSDDQWRAIEVTKDGWRVVENPPVLFRRGAGARPLPVPVKGGTLNALRPLLNAGDDSQWYLMVAWLVGTFLPEGAFSHLVLEGEQGSAKSTTAKLLQSLIDPSDAGLSAPPKDETDATVSALNAGILAYDNLSGCRAELADVLCRFSTGQGYKTRTFYENLGVTVASVKLPVLLNGIDAMVMRGDLLERSITLKLPRIGPENRKTERDIWETFAQVHPGCLGALLDAVSAGLRNLPNTTLTDAPRMSDFCTWLVACEPALPWKPGQFLTAYKSKLEDANSDLAESDSVASALVEWTEKNTSPGSGVHIIAKDLLIALNEITQEWPKDLRHWPLSPESLAHRLVRLAPVLRAQGIEVRKLKRTSKARSRWEIWRPGPQGLLIPRFEQYASKETA